MSEDSLPRGSELLDRRRCTLVVIDVQDKLLPAVCDGPRLVEDLVTLVRGANELAVPALVTEQYPHGLGPTVAPLRSLLPAPIEKLRMSASRSLGWPPASETDRWQVVLCGLETHVCVLQTAFDLVSLGYQVFVPVDAVSCRVAIDGEIALRRMTAAGIALTTIEGVLFEWLESAEAPEFKAISRLVRERAARR